MSASEAHETMCACLLGGAEEYLVGGFCAADGRGGHIVVMQYTGARAVVIPLHRDRLVGDHCVLQDPGASL